MVAVKKKKEDGEKKKNRGATGLSIKNSGKKCDRMWGMMIGKPKASDCVFTIPGERLYYITCAADVQ